MAASLLTNLINIEYLTGLKCTNALLLQTSSATHLFTDGRYLEKARALGLQGRGRLGRFDVHDMAGDFKTTWGEILKKHRIKSLEYDGEDLTVNRLARFKKISPSVTWKDGARDVLKQRAQKDPSELRKLRASQQLNEHIFYSIEKELRVDVTEHEIGHRIKTLALEYGADEVSFPPIVAFGSHSSMPHHQNTDRKLKKGDLVLIDMGVSVEGYASDMTRVRFTASPTAKMETAYLKTLAAQEAGIAAMKIGAKTSKPDLAARKRLGEDAQYFTHSLGHGIGLEVHEAPTVSTRSTETFKANMVVTSEPGLYFPGEFGIRIEDMVRIAPGKPENLTKVPKALRDCVLKHF